MTTIGRYQFSGTLFRKYIAPFLSVVFVVLLINGLFEIVFLYQDHRSSLIRVQREQAEGAAAKIGQFIGEIERQIGWITQLQWSATTNDQRHFDGSRLLRQVPAIADLIQLDSAGKEQLRISRVALDVVASQADLSQEPAFIEAMAKRVYYGPVYFRHESEPHMTLALAGAHRDAGVSIVEINLKLIWDVVSAIKVGERGHAFVIDAQGRLIAHPDINLVLRYSDMTGLAQVQAARATGTDALAEPIQVASDIGGRSVLTASALVAPLGWLVFVELPTQEAYAPLYVAIGRSGGLLLAGVALILLSGLFFAHRIIVPIRTLHGSAARLGSGDLAQRISIKSGDEFEALADQFNNMAARLQESYANLERKVEERTHQLELANLAKSRFLAAASHDLRQPLHALTLFVAQLRNQVEAAERARLVNRIDASVAAMNELFNALLDISKLEAGLLVPEIAEFPIAHLLRRVEMTFAEVSRAKGLSLRVVQSGLWARSDVILLERILLNLVSNAVRYTVEGGVVVGCRRRGGRLRVEVWDSGPGIPEEQRQNIFGEFYRLAGPQAPGPGGLGLGLAIVDRLCRLLGHPIELSSTVNKGSRFCITVPLAAAQSKFMAPSVVPEVGIDGLKGRLIVLIDDDKLALEGMGGLLEKWGCRIVAVCSQEAALTDLAGCDRPPDLIISDYHLSDGKSGVDAIKQLRDVFQAAIPAFLVSGDTAPRRLREAQVSGFPLLYKPVSPMTLRAILSKLLHSHDMAGAGQGQAMPRAL